MFREQSEKKPMEEENGVFIDDLPIVELSKGKKRTDQCDVNAMNDDNIKDSIDESEKKDSKTHHINFYSKGYMEFVHDPIMEDILNVIKKTRVC